MTKEKSFMLVLPHKEKQIKDVGVIIDNLKKASDFSVGDISFDKGTISTNITYLEETFNVEIFPEEFHMFDMFRTQHLFKDLDIKKIEKSKVGICVAMTFSDDYLTSYHLQLKIVNCIVSDALAVLDFCSEKILSSRWAKLAAESSVPPSPRYLYTVQAISEGDCVWLHSHGLNRCGITELEIINSTKEHYDNQYSIIESLASRLMDASELPKEKDPIFLARLTDEISLVVTLVPWKEALQSCEDIDIGGFADRQDGHNENTSVIFVYPSKDDYENGHYEHVSIYNEVLAENPIYMLTTKETERMKALAFERFDYVRNALKNKKNKVLIKIGLEIDDEYRTEENGTDDESKEHIWFVIKEINGDIITAELTQEPYYINGLHTGHIGKYNLSDMTDWLIFTPDMRITSDEVYVL